MKVRLICLLLGLFLIACGTSTSPGQEKEKQAKPLIDEDELLTRLSAQLVPQATTQTQIDQNKIVNYAIDELLDVRSTASGLFYQIIEEGQLEEQAVRWGDVMVIQYKGTFLDGRLFDQSKPGKPLQTKLRQVIPGWQEALQMMHIGGKALFIIPSHLAYGPEGFGNKIPPNALLKFEIQLIDINRY